VNSRYWIFHLPITQLEERWGRGWLNKPKNREAPQLYTYNYLLFILSAIKSCSFYSIVEMNYEFIKNVTMTAGLLKSHHWSNKSFVKVSLIWLVLDFSRYLVLYHDDIAPSAIWEYYNIFVCKYQIVLYLPRSHRLSNTRWRHRAPDKGT